MIDEIVNDMGFGFHPWAYRLNKKEDIHVEMYELGDISTTMITSFMEYCERKMWFEYHTKIRVPLSDIFSMEMGTIFHNAMEQYLEEEGVQDTIEEDTGMLMYPEVEQATYIEELDRYLKGRGDLMILDKDKNELFLLDYKFTTSSFTYVPRTSHMLQLLIYKFIFERELYDMLGTDDYHFNTPYLLYINPRFRREKFHRYEEVYSFGEVTNQYYVKKTDRLDDRLVKKRYGDIEDFRTNKLYYYDFDKGTYQTMTGISDYIVKGMKHLEDVIDSYNIDEWMGKDREGSFTITEEGERIPKKDVEDLVWKCQYCSYSNFCEIARPEADEQEGIELISTDSEEFADRTGAEYEDYGKED